LLKELSKRNITLEVCPTSYRQTGVLKDLSALRTVFDRCREHGVAIAICTDNPGRNPAPCTLPGEYERLIDNDVIEFSELKQEQKSHKDSDLGKSGASVLPLLMVPARNHCTTRKLPFQAGGSEGKFVKTPEKIFCPKMKIFRSHFRRSISADRTRESA
jgi:hypothetical protein